jgi:hypothetical protein
MTLKGWAIKYARAGYRVLPLEPRGKSPLGSSQDSPFHSDARRPIHGCDDATTNVKQIKTWWTIWPDANIGISPPSGMAIVDIDPRNGGARLPTMVPTLESKSGRGDGGGHLFYKSAPENLPGELAPGIDVITGNRYVVAPPSIHPNSGHPYEWVGKFDLTRMQPWPKGLVSPADKPAAPKLNGAHLPLSPSQVAWCLERISADGRDDWRAVGMALKADDGEEGFNQWVTWSATTTKKNFKGEADCRKTWDSFNKEGLTTRSLKYLAESASGESMPQTDPAEDFEVDILDTTPSRPKSPKPSRPRSAQELIMKKFKPIRWAVKNILPEGLYLLAAPPKIGKSWFALQIALAVGGGGKVLTQQAEQGGVLFLALEDSDRRLQSRLNKLGVTECCTPEERSQIFFETTWPRVDQGGVEKLDKWLKEHPITRYVVIDVLERFRARRSAKDNAYSVDYEAITSLKPLCEKYHVTILIVHHTRKAQADDPLDMVSGTQGLSGGADGVLILKRPRGKDEGELHVMSRDLEQEGAYVVKFDRETCQWQLIGEANEVSRFSARREILDVVRSAGKALGPAEIATLTGRTKQSVFKLLQGLVDEGLVGNVNGVYSPMKKDDRVDDVFG